MPIAQLEYQLDNSILTQRTLRLKIGEADVRAYCDQEAYGLRKKVVVPGFRKGNGPLALLRKYYWTQIEGRAFFELKRAALDQVFSLLQKLDQPFLPPEVLDPDSVRLRYGQPLEFAVKYMTDPTGIGGNPQSPQQQQSTVVPGIQANSAAKPQGIPTGPRMPTVEIPGDLPSQTTSA